MGHRTSEAKAGAAVPTSAWAIGTLGWLIPGGGHLLMGTWQRGILQGTSVCLMFLTGLALGGHLFPALGQDKQQDVNLLLQLPPLIANAGAGALYFVCWLLKTGFTEHAERATFEYGNTFLWGAGLLNYLCMLDAFDIAAKRKS